MRDNQFMGFEYPTTNIEEVLLTLITQGHVSIFDFPVLSGFRTRISELCRKYSIKLETQMIERNNKFGNRYKYGLHRLPEEEKEKAIALYKKLNKNYPNK